MIARARGRIVRLVLAAVALPVFVPAAAFAQAGLGGIAGAVKDTTGAVMPGVTVEAASPVLIEKVRSVVTDGEGLYKIIDLRPGVYTVTFSLPGFATVKRDGVELPPSFTATVNVELRVGSLEETVTVSGQSPLVDVQNATQQKTFSDTLVENLPTARTPQSYTPLVPGVVGGLNVAGVESRSMSIHDSRPGESTTAVEGIGDQMARGAGAGNSTFYINPVNIEEITVDSGGTTAERQLAGVFTNIIPREGSNSFNGILYGAFSNHNLEANNLTSALAATGVTNLSALNKLWDVSPAVGGPIMRDKLWFFSSYRASDLSRYIAGLYYNATPTGWVYTPDKSRPAVVEITDGSYSTRLTSQVTPRNKLSVYYELQPHVVFQRGYSATVSPEATSYTPYTPNFFTQAVWKSPITSRLLLEVGVGGTDDDYNGRRQNASGGVSPAVDFTTVSATEQSTGFVFRSAGLVQDFYAHHINRLATARAAASYVTGSHSFKAGFLLKHGTVYDSFDRNGDYTVQLLRGVPTQLTEMVNPYAFTDRVRADLGIFVQDQWTLKHLTLNLGVRDDYFNSAALAVNLAATPLTAAVSYPTVNNVPNWNDLNPRLAAAYDLFGNGKTAVKAALGRYVNGYGIEIASANNPVITSVLSAPRTWSDANGNFIPDCNLTNPAANGECGPLQNLNFGNNNPKATTYDPSVLSGFGKHDYSWEADASIQHQLLAGVSVTGAYFRRWYGNLTFTNNLATPPQDFNPYCLTAPQDSRLPGGGGYAMCDLYDLNPAQVGQVKNVITFGSNLGKDTEVYNGLELTVSARFAKGAQVSGGVSEGRTELSTCFVVNSPQQLLFCDVKPPFQANIKFLAFYPLRWWGLKASAAFQGLPGAPITASYVATVKTNPEIATSLGRNLSAGQATVPLIQPGTLYGARINNTDVRVSKTFTFSRVHVEGMVDVFNVFNSAAVQSYNVTYGPNWLQPTQTLEGRYVKFSAELRF